MQPIVLFIVLLLFLGTGVCVLIGWLAWRRRNEVGAPLLIVLMFGCAAWSFGYGMELFANSVEAKRTWYNISYWGIALIAPAWLGFMLQVSGHAQRLPRSILPLLFVESAILVLLNHTNHLHGLLWNRFWIWNWYGQPFLMVDRAAGFFVHAAYAYVLLILGFVLYGIHLLRSPKISYLQLGFLLFSVLAPFSANILNVLQMSVLGPINLTPLALTTLGATAGWYVFRFRISDLLLVVGPTVFQQMEDGVLVVDMERIVRNLNPAALHVLNRPEGELVNRPLESVLPWAASYLRTVSLSSSRTIGSLSSSRTIGPPSSSRTKGPLSSAWRHEFTTPGADARYVELTITPLYNQRNRQQGELVVLRDVTERKEMEEALRQAHRMEGVGLLAGGIAHDFNNLLTSIMGQNALALHRLPADSAARANIEKSNLSAERAADLTRQLLAYAGKGRLAVEPLNLNATILDNISLMESAVPKKINFRLDLAKELPTIQADRGHIQSIVMNLVLNAVEAIGEEVGQITIKTYSTQLSHAALESFMQSEQLAPGEFVCMAVGDSGRGMDEETMNLIFDPFFSTKSGGRGLGLSTTLGIVRSHGGSMRVRSRLGSGAKFEIILPVLHSDGLASHDQENAKLGEEMAALSGTVLVIDDEEPVRDALGDLLATFGLQVQVATNGQEGLLRYDGHCGAIDLVLLDMSMPVMDGVETYKHLRTRNQNLPILLMSGYTGAVQNGLQEHDVHTRFIHKPYTSQKLHREIAALLTPADNAAQLCAH